MINNNELIDQIKSYNRFLNSDSLNKAYNFALEAHQNQKRDEGVPYIIHPVAVAKILTDLKLDSATITTGLLHDTIEDTNVTYETVKKEFGEEVANLVEGVTKISALEDKASSSSKVLGTSPPCLVLIKIERSFIFFDFLGDKPHGLMISLILLTGTLDISLELSAIANNSGVTLLTRSSVHCADKRTAIRRVNSFE